MCLGQGDRADPSARMVSKMIRDEFHVECCHDKGNWDIALDCFQRHDYVHTYDFHMLSSQLGEGDPVLFVVRNEADQVVMCWPGLRRAIPETDSYDLTSVYGYGGPLIRLDRLTAGALDALFDAMLCNRIISLFSRMHPFFNEDIEELAPYLTKVSDVPIIDIDRQPETLPSYSRDHRSSIKRLMRRGAEVIIDWDLEYLDEFVELYHQTMRGIGARSYFLFEQNFFDELVKATDFKAILHFVKMDGINICGSLMLQTGDILHGYLAGVRPEYRHLAPSKMLYKSAHEWAIEHGLKAVILGPGRPQEGDSLLKFKQGFGRSTLPLYVFRRVLDPSAYEALCSLRGIVPSDTQHFPAYRAMA